MKKLISIYSLILLLLFVGCEPGKVVVDIKASKTKGPSPLTVDFDLSSSVAVGNVAIEKTEVIIKGPDNAEETLTLAKGVAEFKHVFGKVGKYSIEITMLDSIGSSGNKKIEIEVTSPYDGVSFGLVEKTFYETEEVKLESVLTGVSSELKIKDYSWLVKNEKGFEAIRKRS